MAFDDVFSPEQGQAINNVAHSAFLSLLASPGDAPFAAMPRILEGVNANQKVGASKAALKALLLQAGATPEQAEQFSANENIAKLALQNLENGKTDALIGGAMGGGAPVSNLGMGAPKLSPAAPGGPAAGASLTGSQADKAKVWYDEAIKQGATPLEAAAMVGNFTAENGLNTNGKPGDSGTAFGGGQWRHDRLDNLKKLAAQRGEAWDSVPAQVAHTLNELKGGDAGAARARALIAQAKTPEEAAAIFAKHFERPSDKALADSLPTRTGAAAQAYSMFGQGGRAQVASASGAVPAGSAPRAGDNPADLPAENAIPATTKPVFDIPPGQPSDTATTRTQVAQRDYTRNKLQAEVQADLQKIAVLGTRGDRAKGAIEALKLKVQAAQKYLEPTDAQKILQAAGISPDDPQGQSLLLGAIPGNASTSLQKEYGTYREQEMAAGRTPLSQFDYDVALSKAKAASTKVEVGGQEKTYDADQGKTYSGLMTEFQTAGRKAPSTIATLNEAERLMNTPGFVSGIGTERFALPFKQLAAKLGGDPTAPAAMETVRSLANKAVTDQLGGSLGAGVSNADVSFLQKQNASLDNSIEANKALIGYAKKLAERQREVAGLARDYAAKNGGRLDVGFERELDAYARANPLFPEAAEKPATPAKPAAPMNTTDRAISIRNAKAFIAANPGKRDAVIQRLKDAGINTEGF